jgi:hypothetical protein
VEEDEVFAEDHDFFIKSKKKMIKKLLGLLCLACSSTSTNGEDLFGGSSGVAGQSAGGVAATGGEAGAWPMGGAAGAASGGAVGVSDAGQSCSLPEQTPGDCVRAVCDGDGPVLVNDFTDAPLDDGDPCTDDVCVNGSPFAIPAHPKKVAGSPCGNGLVCDSAGACN